MMVFSTIIGSLSHVCLHFFMSLLNMAPNYGFEPSLHLHLHWFWLWNPQWQPQLNPFHFNLLVRLYTKNLFLSYGFQTCQSYSPIPEIDKVEILILVNQECIHPCTKSFFKILSSFQNTYHLFLRMKTQTEANSFIPQ